MRPFPLVWINGEMSVSQSVSHLSKTTQCLQQHICRPAKMASMPVNRVKSSPSSWWCDGNTLRFFAINLVHICVQGQNEACNLRNTNIVDARGIIVPLPCLKMANRECVYAGTLVCVLLQGYAIVTLAMSEWVPLLPSTITFIVYYRMKEENANHVNIDQKIKIKRRT